MLLLSFAVIVDRLRSCGCVYADEETRLLLAAAATPSELATMLERRIAGHPLEHVLGWAEFCGLRIAVDVGVFVPRRRTQFLARQAITLTRPGTVLVDLCCGSGAVAAEVASQVQDVEVHAVDIDPTAVHCAQKNLSSAGGQVYEGDLYAPLPINLPGNVDVLVANAPYVPTESICLLPPEARDHEPRVALDGGSDGLDIQRRVAAAASQWLVAGGSLLIETSERQAPQTAAIIAAAGLVASIVQSDELEATVVIGTKLA